MECLKKRAEEPVRIADEAGVCLAVVLEAIGGCLDRNAEVNKMETVITMGISGRIALPAR